MADGGKMQPKPIPYSPPQGPTGQMRQGPGLGGTVSRCGSQGEYSTSEKESGSPGIGGSRTNSGSQR